MRIDDRYSIYLSRSRQRIQFEEKDTHTRKPTNERTHTNAKYQRLEWKCELFSPGYSFKFDEIIELERSKDFFVVLFLDFEKA